MKSAPARCNQGAFLFLGVSQKFLQLWHLNCYLYNREKGYTNGNWYRGLHTGFASGNAYLGLAKTKHNIWIRSEGSAAIYTSEHEQRSA